MRSIDVMLSTLLTVALQSQAIAEEPKKTTLLATGPAQALSANRSVDEMLSRSDLQLRRQSIEPLLPSYLFQQFDQFKDGVPVWGGSVTRELSASQPASIFGVVVEIPDTPSQPAIDADTA